jgi:hypothetical protein
MTQQESLKDIQRAPGIGKSLAADLYAIGIRSLDDLKTKNPQKLYDDSNRHAGAVQDPCVLYAFRCAVYFARTPKPELALTKWWNWKDRELE